MTAPFTASLCGYRDKTGHPSTSDSNDKGSITWGNALFDALSIKPGTSEVPSVGSAMEKAAADHLATLRPDLQVLISQPASKFEQYRHLDVFSKFRDAYKSPNERLTQIARSIEQLPKSKVLTAALEMLKESESDIAYNHSHVSQLLDLMPEESMLKIDITLSTKNAEDRLLIGLSSKWSLRTDRAQDCISQGSKLVSMRHGHMPHYAVLTMEPRPSMLKLIAYGSGSVDCVYHLALPQLRSAAESIEKNKGEPWRPRVLLERMVSQRRVRSYEDLVSEVMRLPEI
ncbi:NgoMIV family type II restriction endonuclease [Nocardia sp. NPDC055321]